MEVADIRLHKVKPYVQEIVHATHQTTEQNTSNTPRRSRLLLDSGGLPLPGQVSLIQHDNWPSERVLSWEHRASARPFEQQQLPIVWPASSAHVPAI